ncbi:ATP-binding cassette domain-containing protein [Gilliamella sp. Pra-s65]|uniref:ABC transporter ATP-binding protein n=1 Tax=unclassified Gilliamella TaxID=2685620 RepID=UPI0013286E64|nr:MULTISPECIES: ABC transporter ATP-binding protein [unclassified Gilliamella]MWN31584.1 ATP-binding cassette domain-containing protein [Gilliamella sp. Pra-s60]MWN89341.1 ATP-binding cassette domain-containing protein [Gilliamella sp. Pra-s65]MWP28691.1 ATP-binding cassette domain-containing protein [Gilliamella sp. Pra-s54]MWP45978.1 ATP-binding cassette domain-containing protein [Gilliamella sp. Pas-s27]MWP72384.1 ATP-binding cassette domain-containing protein [Gilliamella sp. Pra-s52]
MPLIPALELISLKKIYKNGVVALKGIDLTVEAGDFYALLGPNGAGKSTTIGIISSLVTKSSGQVKIFGHDLDTDVVNAKRQLGLVPQEFNFNQFEEVLQIVTNQGGYYGLHRKLALERAEKYLRVLDLWDKRHSRASMLSGGMKRRLMIARALVHEPKLLILDEPTAGVDIELRRSMWDFLREINRQGITIILTTHYLEEAEMLCRNIGIIQSGQLIANSSMRELLAKSQSETIVIDYIPIPKRIELKDYNYSDVEQGMLEVKVDKQHGLNQLFEQLNQQNIKVISVRNKANRLEELFVDLLHNENKQKESINE